MYMNNLLEEKTIKIFFLWQNDIKKETLFSMV